MTMYLTPWLSSVASISRGRNGERSAIAHCGAAFVHEVDHRLEVLEPLVWGALVPLERRSSWVAGHEVWSRLASSQADPELGPALDRLFPDRVADL